MKNNSELIFRHECKFLVTNIQAEIIKNQVAMFCESDVHVGIDGTYEIKSIYFDTNADRFWRETLEGLNVRHKFRIRAYNSDLTRISLEKKSTERELKHKDSEIIPLELCKDLAYGDIASVDVNNYSVAGMMQAEGLIEGMVPRVVIRYIRTPYVHPIGNVRITFDSDICVSEDIDSFFDKDYEWNCEVMSGMQVLEVKYDDFLPSQIRSTLNSNGIMEQTSFSKYSMGRTVISEGVII